ncbi:MAG: hypothetical protein PHC54_05970 [Candidatus Omnitrophica bacterium]|nr:hypothetical protein [Candidatus Omnitrophota bacterium]MDD5592784.1 hypothetical protein [Candidatus Omnitrophota bacterium]
MKKKFLVLGAITFISSLFFIQLFQAKAEETKTLSTTQAKVPEMLVNAAENNIFIGKVVKGGVTFSLRCPYRFVIVTDNGERKDIWVPRDGLRITDVNGKSVYGAPPRKGRKMEIKYLIGDNGQYEAASMRYVPLDYVPQPAALTTPANAAAETTQLAQESAGQTGDTFTGRVESVKKMLPRPPYWRLALLTAVADSGEMRSIDIVSDTAVRDASGKDMGKGRGAWHLKNGGRIEVKYSPSANNGHDKAVSIHCLD